MNFGYLFEYYTPVTNSLTIFVGVRRLISHQTPGASKKWQQPPQTLHHFCHLKKIPRKIYPPHETYTNQVWSSPPQKNTWVILNSNTSPFFGSFFQGIPPETCWQRSPWSWQERHSNLCPVGFGVLKPLSQQKKLLVLVGGFAPSPDFFQPLLVNFSLENFSIHCWFAHH